MITRNRRTFNKQTLSKIINLLYVSDNSNVQFLSADFHNCFGERKGRLKIKKRRWVNLRAHLRKETPQQSLRNYDSSSNEIFETFLNLPQHNELDRYNRLNFINTINSQIRNTNKTPINITRLINKIIAIIKLLYNKHRADRRNVLAVHSARDMYKVLELLRKKREFKKK